MFVIYDCESNGKAKDFKAKMSDLENWPRITQLAWSVYDADMQLKFERNFLILPDGWTIPKEKFFIDNGMSTERNMAFGVPVLNVLTDFINDIQGCEYMVAHNFAFDYNVMGAEMIRGGVRSEKKLKGICTMERTINFCQLPSASKWSKDFKWPKLEELHIKLFGCNFTGAHDAMDDVRATSKCFFECVKRGIIQL